MVGVIDEWWIRLLFGVVGGGLAAAAAYRIRALSISGAWAAFVMGASFVLFGEPIWIALLLSFFISSSFWSVWKKKNRTKAAAEQKYEKTGRRDAGQVWANGGIGLIFCILAAIWSHPFWLYGYIGVMAAVTADTWATELGALSRSKPRSIVTGKRVEPGTSGGITILGSVAAFSGAAFIAVVAYIWLPSIWLVIFAALAGFIGAMVDSYLGATVQAMYRCPKCHTETERTSHCQLTTVRIRGFNFMNNDRVNMISSLVAACLLVVAAGLWLG
ncbi:DUF92 domain-containing protein [Paenibacillus yanchengensis]|uniref:DUF92 domain-containing protein n=1 Tax=Paenibacillus yanchengensis TaxID=2035833 RepID=A0ABW4YNP1_9BACL